MRFRLRRLCCVSLTLSAARVPLALISKFETPKHLVAAMKRRGATPDASIGLLAEINQSASRVTRIGEVKERNLIQALFCSGRL